MEQKCVVVTTVKGLDSSNKSGELLGKVGGDVFFAVNANEYFEEKSFDFLPGY